MKQESRRGIGTSFQGLKDIQSRVATSLWFLPGVLVLTSSLLAFLFLHLDQEYPLTIGGTIVGFFGGSASGARNLLSTIAGSLITVISMAFSITMVALQQASTQYSPRILRNFTSDRGNQVVLGTYLATFIYSLLVLRVIRADQEDSSAYVPALSISFAIFLAVVCSGLLIYFINHIASSLQAEHLVESIHKAWSIKSRIFSRRSSGGRLMWTLRVRSYSKTSEKPEKPKQWAQEEAVSCV
ncbi:MAG: DUF2254 family protein [Syntrophobacteraceae bacterium]